MCQSTSGASVNMHADLTSSILDCPHPPSPPLPLGGFPLAASSYTRPPMVCGGFLHFTSPFRGPSQTPLRNGPLMSIPPTSGLRGSPPHRMSISMCTSRFECIHGLSGILPLNYPVVWPPSTPLSVMKKMLMSNPPLCCPVTSIVQYCI